jgi:hydrogenase expression/formation protein HypC
VALPGKIVAIDPDQTALKMATVDFGGPTRTVCLDYLREVDLGDYVVVHMGFAVEKVTEQQAAEAYEALEMIRDVSGVSKPGT